MPKNKSKPKAADKATKSASKARRGRDGKFLRGTGAGPGRPSKAREEQVARAEGEFLREFRKAISLDDFRAIVAAHVKAAKREWPSKATPATALPSSPTRREIRFQKLRR